MEAEVLEIDLGKLRKQFDYLNHLNRLKQRALVAKHDKVFRGTQFFMEVPRNAHKEFMIRRLWFWYCMNHYHYPRGHMTTVAFTDRAKAMLAHGYDERIDSVYEVSRAQALNHRAFSREAIKSMPINKVDRLLAVLGIFAEVEPWKRKRLLWEYYNRPTKSKSVKDRHQRINNKWFLTDVILAHPTMTFDQFVAVYSNQMPSVTRTSYNNCRWRLKGAGYQIPTLKPGPGNPARVSIDGIYERGRHEENEDG